MGTRWRHLLAPVGVPTGDGRRFAAGSITHRELPLALKWQRSDEPGHDTSVSVASIDSIEVGDGEVWGEGEWFDDIDAQAMPRLAEDVAEAMHLYNKGVLGPSVDAGSATATEVDAATGEPFTDEQWMEIMEGGEMPATEILFSAYEIAAATLVPIPAYAETGQAAANDSEPAEEEPADGDDGEGECPDGQHLVDGECVPIEEDEPAPADTVAAAARFALVASAPVLDASLFDDPQLSEVTPFTYDPETGRVFGHLATFDTCHVGYKSMCVAPPESVTDYAMFHRYPLNTTAGLVAAGRLTTGHGKTGTGCTHAGCRNLDDHACTELDFAGAVAHHDGMRQLAHVRVGVDETNNAIWFAGVATGDLTPDDVRVMSRREVSGDWRDYAGTLELGEILALASADPGFPLPHAAVRDGRQVALVAAAPVRPPVVAAGLPLTELAEIADTLTRIAGQLMDASNEEEAEQAEEEDAPVTEEPDMTGVVAALQSTIDHARGQLATRQASALKRKLDRHVLR